MRKFGREYKNFEYTKRTGAYGLVVEEGKVALIQVPQGLFLPGGGVEKDESIEDALKREFSEELGWEIRNIEHLGQARQFYYSDFLKKHIVNLGYFYIVQRDGVIDRELEEDHVLVWLDVAVAAKKLFHKHQGWAVQEYINDYTK